MLDPSTVVAHTPYDYVSATTRLKAGLAAHFHQVVADWRHSRRGRLPAMQEDRHRVLHGQANLQTLVKVAGEFGLRVEVGVYRDDGSCVGVVRT